MERLLEMLGVLAVMYAGYALSVKNWDYTSEAAREKRKAELKKRGLANTFYFINARTQLVLTLASGGTFTLYWLYQQWRAVLRGFKRADGIPLKGGPFLRTLAGAFTFFSLASLINRTCEYMRHPTAWPAGLWGLVWLAGLACVFLPAGWTVKALGYFFFCAAPAVYQRRLNALPKTPVPASPKIAELAAAAAGLVGLLGLLVLARVVFAK